MFRSDDEATTSRAMARSSLSYRREAKDTSVFRAAAVRPKSDSHDRYGVIVDRQAAFDYDDVLRPGKVSLKFGYSN